MTVFHSIRQRSKTRKKIATKGINLIFKRMILHEQRNDDPFRYLLNDVEIFSGTQNGGGGRANLGSEPKARPPKSALTRNLATPIPSYEKCYFELFNDFSIFSAQKCFWCCFSNFYKLRNFCRNFLFIFSSKISQYSPQYVLDQNSDQKFF